MAFVKSAKGTQLLVRILTSAPGVTPKTYAHPCTINAARDFTVDVAFTESTQIDCDDPDAPAFVERDPNTISSTITGSGTLNTPDYSDWFDWSLSGEAKECQVVLNANEADGGLMIVGDFVLSSLSLGGDRGGKMSGGVTLLSDGEFARAELA